MRNLAAWMLLACAGLAGCGGNEPVTEREQDPALAAALNEPIMIDPDLVGQNRANNAAAMPSQDASLPTFDNDTEAIAAAREEAVRLVGGPGRMRTTPDPREISGAVPGVGADCAGRARETMQWAARMPPAFPVYPRGAVQQAAGTDARGCALRVVNFVTPVPLDEVIDFYFTRASAAGFSADRTRSEGDHRLSGARGGRSYAVHVRRLRSGNTEVDLVTAGGLGN